MTAGAPATSGLCSYTQQHSKSAHTRRRPPLFARILQKVWLFENLEDKSLEELASHFQAVSLAEDQKIFRVGQPAESFYVIERGAVVIVHDTVGRPVELLARLGPGDFFGEGGLLDGLPRSASARTTAPTRLLAIDRASFLKYLDRQPLLKIQLRRAAIERHTANVHAATAERTLRKDVRVSVDRRVVLHLEDGSRVHCQLDNLSLGGAAIQGAPGDWHLRNEVHLRFGLPGQVEPLLDLTGVVTWRKGSKVGLAFRSPTPQMRIHITRALQELLESRPKTT